MKKLKPTKAWILLCSILTVTYATTGHRTHYSRPNHGTSSHQKKYILSPVFAPIQIPEHVMSKTEQISCVSADINIFDIMIEARASCKGNDMHVKFYYFADNKYYYIGAYDINKELFDALLIKYDNWLITAERIDLKHTVTFLPDHIARIYNNKVNASRNKGKDWTKTSVVDSEDEPANKNLYIDKFDHDMYYYNAMNNNNEPVESNKHSVNLNAKQPTEYGGTYIDTEEKKGKYGNYINVRPKFDKDRKYFEVFLPKDDHVGPDRTINVNIINNEKDKYLYFEGDIDKVKSYKPVQVELKDHLVDITNGCTLNDKHESKTQNDNKKYNQRLRTSDLNVDFGSNGHDKNVNKVIYFKNKGLNEPHQYLNIADANPINDKTIINLQTPITNDQTIDRVSSPKDQHVFAKTEHYKEDYNNYYVDLRRDELQNALLDDRKANKIPAIASQDSAFGSSDLNTLQYDKKYNLDPTKNIYEHGNLAPKRISTEKLVDIYNAHDFDDSHQLAGHDKTHIHINEPVYKIKKHSRENDHHSAPYIFKLPKKYSAHTELDYPKPNTVSSYETIPPISDLPSIPDILFDPIQTMQQFLDISKTSKPESQFSTVYTLAPSEMYPLSQDASMISPFISNSDVLSSLPGPQYASFMPVPPIETVMLMKKGSITSPLNVGVSWLPSHSRIEELRIPNTIKTTSLDHISQNQLTSLPVSSKEKLTVTASESVNDNTNLPVEPVTTKIIPSYGLGTVKSPVTYNQQQLNETPMILDQSNTGMEPHILTLPSNIDFDRTEQGKVSSVTTIPFSPKEGMNLPHHLQGFDLNSLPLTPNSEYERISADSGLRDSSAMLKVNHYDTMPILKAPKLNVIAPDISSETVCETPVLNPLVLTDLKEMTPDISVESQYIPPISESQPIYQFKAPLPSDLINYQITKPCPLKKILSSYVQPHKPLMPSLSSVLSDEELRNYLPIQHGINLKPSSGTTGLVLNSDLIETTPCDEPFLENLPSSSISIYRPGKTNLAANSGIYEHGTPYETLYLPKQNNNLIADQEYTDYTVIPSQKLQLSNILDKWSVSANPNLNTKLINNNLSYMEPDNTIICPDCQTLGKDLQRLLSESLASTPVELQASAQENLKDITSNIPLIYSSTLPHNPNTMQYYTTPLSGQNTWPQHFLPNSDEETYQYIEDQTNQLKNIFKPSLGFIRPQLDSILPNTIFENLPLDSNVLNSPLLQPILQSLPASKYPNNYLLGPSLPIGLSPLDLPGPCSNIISLPKTPVSPISGISNYYSPQESILASEAPVNLFTPPSSAISRLFLNKPFSLQQIPLLPPTSYSSSYFPSYMPLTSSYLPQIVKPSYTPLLTSPQSISINPALMGNIKSPYLSPALLSTDDFTYQNIPYGTEGIPSIPIPQHTTYSAYNIKKPVPSPSKLNVQGSNALKFSLESPDYIEYFSPNLLIQSVSNKGISSAVKPCFEPSSLNTLQYNDKSPLYDKSLQNIDYLNTPEDLPSFFLSPTSNIQSNQAQHPLTIQSLDKAKALFNDILHTLQSTPESQYNAKLNPFVELKPLLTYNSQLPEQSMYQKVLNNLQASSESPVSKNFVKENADLQTLIDTYETVSPIWSNVKNASTILSLLRPYKSMLPQLIADDYHIIPTDSQSLLPTDLQHISLPEYVDNSPINYESISQQNHLHPASIASDPTLEGLSLSEIISNHPSSQSNKARLEGVTEISRPLVYPKKYLQNSIPTSSEVISSLPATLLPHPDFTLSSPIETMFSRGFSQESVPNLQLSPHPYTNNVNIPTSLSYMPLDSSLIQNTESKQDYILSPTLPVTNLLVETDMPKDLLKLIQQDKQHNLERLYENSAPSDDSFLINKEFNQISKHSPIISNIPENFAPLDYNSITKTNFTPHSPMSLKYPISKTTKPQVSSNYPQTLANSQLNAISNILDNYISEASPSLQLAGKHITSNIGNTPTFTLTQINQLSEPDLLQISQPRFIEQPALTSESSVFLPLLVKTSTSENVISPDHTLQELKPKSVPIYKHQSQSLPHSYSILDNELLDSQSSTLNLPNHLLKPSLDDLTRNTYTTLPNSQLLDTPISVDFSIPLEPCYTSNLLNTDITTPSPSLVPQYNIDPLLSPGYRAPHLSNQYQPISLSKPLLPTFTSPLSLESISELPSSVRPIPLSYPETQAPMFLSPIQPSQTTSLQLSTSPLLAANTNSLATAYASQLSPAIIQSLTNTRPILEAYSNPIAFSPHLQSHDAQPVPTSSIRPLSHAFRAPLSPNQSNLISHGYPNSVTPLYTSLLNHDEFETIKPSVQSNVNISPISSSSSLLNSQNQLNSLPQDSILPLNSLYQARPSVITPNIAINPSMPIESSIPLNIGANIPEDILEAIEQSISSVSPLPKKYPSSSSNAIICEGTYITDEDITKELNLYSLLESNPKTTEGFNEIIAGKTFKETPSPLSFVRPSNIETYLNQNENLLSPYYTPLSTTWPSRPLSKSTPFLLPTAQGNLPNSEYTPVLIANTPQQIISGLPSLLPSSSNIAASPILSSLPYINLVSSIPPKLIKPNINIPLPLKTINPLLNAKLSPCLSPTTYELADLNPEVVPLNTLSNPLYSTIPSTGINKAPLSPVYPSELTNLGYSEALQLQPPIVPVLKSVSPLPYTILPSNPPSSLVKPPASKYIPFSPSYTILPSRPLLSPKLKQPIPHSIPLSLPYNIPVPVSNYVPLTPSYIELISNVPQLQGPLTQALVHKHNKYQSPLSPLYTKLQNTLPIKTHSLPSQYINPAPVFEDLKSPINDDQSPKTNPYHSHITKLKAIPSLDLGSNVFKHSNALPTSKFLHPQYPIPQSLIDSVASENPCEYTQLLQKIPKELSTGSPQSLSDQIFTQESLPSSLIPSLSSESLLSEDYLDSSQTQNSAPNTLSSSSLPFDSSSQLTPSKLYPSFIPQYSSPKDTKSCLRPSFNLYQPYKHLYSNLRPIGQAISPQTVLTSPPSLISTVMHPNPLPTASDIQMHTEPLSGIDMSSSQYPLSYSPLKPTIPLNSPLNKPIYGSAISSSDIINSLIGSNSKTYPCLPPSAPSVNSVSEPISKDLKPTIPQYSDASPVELLPPDFTASLNHLPSLTKPLTHSVISQLLQSPNLQYTRPTFGLPKLSPLIGHLSKGMNKELNPLEQLPYSLAPQSSILDTSIPYTDKLSLSSYVPKYIQELTPVQTTVEYLNTQDVCEPVLDVQHSYPQTSIASKYLPLPTGLPQRQTNLYLSILPAESLKLPSEIADSVQSLQPLSNTSVPISPYYLPRFIPAVNPLYLYPQVTPFSPIQLSSIKPMNSSSNIQPQLPYALPVKPTSLNQLERLPLFSPTLLNPDVLQSYSSLNAQLDTLKPFTVSPVTSSKYLESYPTDLPKSAVPYESLSSYSPSDVEITNQGFVDSESISYAKLIPPSLKDIEQGVHTDSTVYSQLENTLSDVTESEVCDDNIQYLDTIFKPDVSLSAPRLAANSDFSKIIPEAVNSHEPNDTPLYNTILSPLNARPLLNDVPLKVLPSPQTLGSPNTQLPNKANYYVHTSNLPGQSRPVLLNADTRTLQTAPYASLLSPYIQNMLPMPLLKAYPNIKASQTEQWYQNPHKTPSHIGIKPMSLPYPLKSLTLSEIPYMTNKLEATTKTKITPIKPTVTSDENYMEVEANKSLDEAYENADTQTHISELEEANYEETIFDTNTRDLTEISLKPSKYIDEGISKIAQRLKHNNYIENMYEELDLESELNPNYVEENFDYFANLISNKLLELNEDEYETYDAENVENINTQFIHVNSSDFNVGREPNNVIQGEYISENNAASNLASDSKFIHPNSINLLPIIPKYLPINALNSNIGYIEAPINIASNQNNILSQLSKIDPKYTPYNTNRGSYNVSPIKYLTLDPTTKLYSKYKTIPNDNSKYGGYYTSNIGSRSVDNNYNTIPVSLYDKNPVTKDFSTNDYTEIPSNLPILSPYINTVASTSKMDSNPQNSLNSFIKSDSANSPIILDNFSQTSRDFTSPKDPFNNIDNTKYSGYKTYTPSFDPNICQNVIKGPYSNSDTFSSFPQYENAGKSTPSNWDLNNIQQSLKSNGDPIEDMRVCNMEVDDDLKRSLINYINKNKDKINLNNEVVLPIDSFALANGEPCYNYTIKTNNPSVGLKVWKSNVKIVQAEIKLKFKDLSVMNFMPIVNNLDENDINYINEIIKEYINEKYGNHIEVKEPYVINNQYKLIKDFDKNFGGKYNLLWPAQCVS